jgi:hypothetical protein
MLATDLAVGGSNPSRRATKPAAQRPGDRVTEGCLHAGLRPNCDHIGGHFQLDCDHVRPHSPVSAAFPLVSVTVAAPARSRREALAAFDLVEKVATCA